MRVFWWKRCLHRLRFLFWGNHPRSDIADLLVFCLANESFHARLLAGMISVPSNYWHHRGHQNRPSMHVLNHKCIGRKVLKDASYVRRVRKMVVSLLFYKKGRMYPASQLPPSRSPLSWNHSCSSGTYMGWSYH